MYRLICCKYPLMAHKFFKPQSWEKQLKMSGFSNRKFSFCWIFETSSHLVEIHNQQQVKTFYLTKSLSSDWLNGSAISPVNVKLMVCNTVISRVGLIKFSIKNFFTKCDQICRKLRIWSYLLKKFFNEKLHFLCIVKAFNDRY